MKNWILKLILKNFIGPIVDSIILIMERLASMSDTTVDDMVVQHLKNYRNYIVQFLLQELDGIIRAKKAQKKI